MARSVDVVKLRLWQQRLRRFDRCNLTVAAFCQAEGVSPPSFYHWRKKLDAPLDASASGSPPREAPRFSRATVSNQAFVPVEIVQASTIEIHLPNGARLSLPCGDRLALEAAVAAVGGLPKSSDTEIRPC